MSIQDLAGRGNREGDQVSGHNAPSTMVLDVVAAEAVKGKDAQGKLQGGGFPESSTNAVLIARCRTRLR